MSFIYLFIYKNRSNPIINFIKTSELFSLSKLPNSLTKSFTKFVTGPPLASKFQNYDENSNGPHEHNNENSHNTIGLRGTGPQRILRSESQLFELPTMANKINFKRSFHQASNYREKSTFSISSSNEGIPKPPKIENGILKDDSRSSSSSPEKSQTFTYLMVGGAGVIGAMAAKSTVMNFLTSLSAAGDVLAMAQVEMDLSSIPEGKSVVIKWRGKPIFIRHRTPAEIESAQKTDISHLRDPQADSDRVQKPEWLIMLGICTHLGCVPISDSGDYGGWYCPCQ